MKRIKGRRRSRVCVCVRMRASENECYVDLFRVKKGVYFREALLESVKAFLQTPDGDKSIKETHHDFNWGDAMVYVPQSIWRKFGLRRLENAWSETLTVDQDEILIPEEE